MLKLLVIFYAALVSVIFSSTGALAQSALSGKEVWIYLDTSGTVMNAKVPAVRRPSARLEEMLSKLLEARGFLDDSDSILVTSFGDQVENAVDVTSASGKSDALNYLKRYGDPENGKLTSPSTTNFSRLFDAVAKDLSSAADAPRMILIASDFIPDPLDGPCRMPLALKGDFDGAVASVQRTNTRNDLRAKYTSAVAALNRAREAINAAAETKSKTAFALFAITPERPEFSNPTSVDCYMDEVSKVERGNGLLGQMATDLPRTLVYSYTEFSDGNIDDFIQRLNAELLRQIGRPGLRLISAERNGEAFRITAEVDGPLDATFELTNPRIELRGENGTIVKELTSSPLDETSISGFRLAGELDFVEAANADSIAVVVDWNWLGANGRETLREVVTPPDVTRIETLRLISVWHSKSAGYTLEFAYTAEAALSEEFREASFPGSVSSKAVSLRREASVFTVTLTEKEAVAVFARSSFQIRPKIPGAELTFDLDTPTRTDILSVDEFPRTNRDGDEVTIAFELRASDSSRDIWQRINGIQIETKDGNNIVVQKELRPGADIHPSGSGKFEIDLTRNEVVRARGATDSIRARLLGFDGQPIDGRIEIEMPAGEFFPPSLHSASITTEPKKIQIVMDQLASERVQVFTLFDERKVQVGELVSSDDCEVVEPEASLTSESNGSTAALSCNVPADAWDRWITFSSGLVRQKGYAGSNSNETDPHTAKILFIPSKIGMSNVHREEYEGVDYNYLVPISSEKSDTLTFLADKGSSAEHELAFFFKNDAGEKVYATPAKERIFIRRGSTGGAEFGNPDSGSFESKLDIKLLVGSPESGINFDEWKKYTFHAVLKENENVPIAKPYQLCNHRIGEPCRRWVDSLRLNSTMTINFFSLFLIASTILTIYAKNYGSFGEKTSFFNFLKIVNGFSATTGISVVSLFMFLAGFWNAISIPIILSTIIFLLSLISVSYLIYSANISPSATTYAFLKHNNNTRSNPLIFPKFLSNRKKWTALYIAGAIMALSVAGYMFAPLNSLLLSFEQLIFGRN